MFHLETPRLTISPHLPADADLMLSWMNDPDLVFVNDDLSDLFEPFSRKDMERMIDAFISEDAQGSELHFTVRLKVGGSLIGAGSIHKIDRHHRRCTIGLSIGQKSEWGKGYASEALTAVIDYAFTSLNMNRITAEIYCFNERSVRLFTGLGFQHEGTIRQAVFKKGQFHDDCLFGLLRADWDARKTSIR
jgi:RimJ/RimL family protein N-acetyltransferase